MSVAKIIEVSASSSVSVEDAVRSGLKKVAETVKGIQGAWINETKVVTAAASPVRRWRRSVVCVQRNRRFIVRPSQPPSSCSRANLLRWRLTCSA